MATRILTAIAVSPVIAILGLVSIAGQSGSAPAFVISAYNGGPPVAFTVPRTPWGDPDLQGVWSATTPTAFPCRGRRTWANGSIRPGRSSRRASSRSKPASAAPKNAIGSFRGDFATRAFRQTSLIVDPPDGRQPAVTAEAQKRRAPRDQGTFGNGPFETPEV